MRPTWLLDEAAPKPTMPSMSMRTNNAPLCIVIAANRETGDGLHGYFSKSGFTTRTSCRLQDVGPLCIDAHCVVLFPDDFSEDEVLTSIRALRREQPRLLMLLVTATPQRFQTACAPNATTLSPIVVPKPAFGWSLLDAMRGQFKLS